MNVTLSTSQMTWRTSSWNERRSALCFWTCSETLRVHCRKKLVSWSWHLPAPRQAEPTTPTKGFGRTLGVHVRARHDVHTRVLCS